MKNSFLAALCATFLLAPRAPMAMAQPGPPRGNPPRFGPPRQGPPRSDNGGFPPPPRFGGEFGDKNGPPRGPRPQRGAKGQLQGLWHDLDHLGEAKQPLSNAQARKIVALTLPWTKKPQMSEAAATQLLAALRAVLTSAQRDSLGEPPRFGPPNGQGGGFGRGGRGPNGFGPPNFGDGPPPRNGRFDGRPAGPPDGNLDGPPRDGRRDGGFGGRSAPPTASERAAATVFFDASQPFYPPTGYGSWKKLPARLQQDIARHYRETRATLERLSRQSRS